MKRILSLLILCITLSCFQVAFAKDKTPYFSAKKYEINNREIIKLSAFKIKVKNLKKLKFMTLAELNVIEENKPSSHLLAKSF